MFCSKCGKEIPDNSEFCPKCGNKLNEGINKNQKKIDKNRESITEKISSHKLLFVAIIAIVLIIIISISVVFINFKTSNKTIQNVAENNINNTDYERYLNILSGKEKFLFQEDMMNVTETVLNDVFSNLEIQKVEYAIFDIDNDNCEEMFTKLYYKDNPIPYIFVFNIQDDLIYGMLFTYREVEDLKEDGSFIGSGGAEHYRICNMKFDKFSVIKTELASRDGFVYKIDNKVVTEDEFNNYYNIFKNKKNLELNTYEINITKQYNHGIEIGKMYRYENTYIKDGMTFGDDWSVECLDEKNAYIMFYTYNSGDGVADYGTYTITENKLNVTIADETFIFTILDDGTLKYDFTGYIFK